MSVRLMTYNILDDGEHREAHILEVIRTSKPDIVVLQEIFTEDFLRFLSESLGMNYYFGEGNRKRRVALLSKLPVLSFESYHPLFPIWRNFIDAQIEYQSNKTIRIIGVHPIANLGVLFEIWRFWEAKYITNYIKRYQNEPCLIAGDFNAIAPGETTKTENMPARLKWIIYLQGNRVYHFSIGLLLSTGFTDCFRFLNSEEGFTLPPPNPNARLDYIFVNAKMKPYLEKCWVVQAPNVVNLASDHYPVMAEFGLSK
jgi:endonuclease/exonuclease/phosphatase family metal-dependent hydrolase